MAARATRLFYDDAVLATLDLPGAPLVVTRGVGSGLTRRAGDPPGVFWAVGDRGPNLKVKLAIGRYGLEELSTHRELDGAKVMPYPQIGPAMTQMRVVGDRVEMIRAMPLVDDAGVMLTGLPTPGAPEPALAIDGTLLAPDPAGADTEGIAAVGDGFVIGEEYSPSLLHVTADGVVQARWVPKGCAASFTHTPYPVIDALPAIAARRQLNRGFEALAASADGASLFLAFQSPLAHPDEAAHAQASHVRLWRMEAASGRVAAQWLYPLDPPHSFARDVALGPVERSDVKVSELVVLAPDRLLILERASATTKLYAVTLDPALRLGEEHLDPATRPTLEELSARGGPLPALAKTLIVSTDDLPEVSADLEGLLVLDARTLLLVNDNDFGVEGVETAFWRVELGEPLF